MEEHRPLIPSKSDQHAVPSTLALPPACDPLLDDLASKIRIDETPVGVVQGGAEHRSVIRSCRWKRAKAFTTKARILPSPVEPKYSRIDHGLQYGKNGAGDLPGRFGPGQPAADDVDGRVRHGENVRNLAGCLNGRLAVGKPNRDGM
jgi:hypothetical protein